MTTVTDLDTALDHAGIPVRGAELLAALAQLGAQRLVQEPVSGTPLTPDEQTMLARHSGVSPDGEASGRVRARAAAKTALLYVDTLSTDQVARMIKRSTSRIRHMAKEQRLYTLPVDRRSGLRFPAWQFSNGEPLPGLSTVLAALPAGLHPLQVLGFFSTPTMELSLGDEKPITPLQWLRDGGDEATVAALAGSVGELP